MPFGDYTEDELQFARDEVEARATRVIERTEDRYEAQLLKLRLELAQIRGNRDVLSAELNRLRGEDVRTQAAS